jgi:WD40 repeat protein
MKYKINRFPVPNSRAVTTLDWSPDADELVIGQQATTDSVVALGIWSITHGSLTRELISGVAAVPLAARFSPLGRLLAYADENQDLVMYDLSTARGDRSAFPMRFAKWLSFAGADGRLIAGGTTTSVWDPHIMAVVWTLPVSPLPAEAVIEPPCCALSPAGDHVAASGVDSDSVIIYDIEKGGVSSRIDGTIDSARSIAFDPSGTFLAAVSQTGGAGLWNLVTGIALLTDRLNQSADYYWCVRFHPDGNHVAFGLLSGFVEIFNFHDASVCLNQEAPVHNGRVWDLAFAPDGKRMVSGGEDGMVLIWELE